MSSPPYSRETRRYRYSPGDELPPPLRSPGDGGLILLLARDAAGWAAGVALELADAWARNGRRVVIADLMLEDPLLHERLGLPNLDGMVDVFFYGASLSKTARPVPGRDFYFVPAGTYTADRESVYTHPRWPRIAAGFAEADASLLVLASDDAATLVDTLAGNVELILLGDGAEPPRGTVAPRASLVPAADDVVDGAPVAAAAGAPPPPPDVAPPPADATLPEGVRVARRRPRQRGVAPFLWLLGAAGVAGVLGYVFLLRNPAALPPAANPAVEGAAALPAIRGKVEGVPLPYSVQVVAFNSFDAARDRLREYQDEFTEAPFYISPQPEQGVLYYKLLAGMAPDTATAGVLRDALVEADIISEEEAAPGAWSLTRETPLAYRLGEFETQEKAAATADSLLAREVPTYAVGVPLSGGGEAWILYAGAYPDSAAARTLGETLQQSGITAPLVTRVGPRPGAPR